MKLKKYKYFKNLSMDEIEKNEILYQKFHKQENKRKWFSLDRMIEFFGEMNLWMILGKKGIGKTYFFIELMRSLDKKNNNDMITYVRLTKKEVDSVRDEWRSNPQLYPFQIKGRLIYSKKYKSHTPICSKPLNCTCPFQIKGNMAYATDLSDSRGEQNPNLRWILFDEFINETGSYKFRNSLASQFVTFYSNKIRHKEVGVVKTVMMANNNSMNNPYLEYFNINHHINLWRNNKKKQLFINLRDLYKRANKQVRDMASHRIDVLAYIDNNKNFDLANKIINKAEIVYFSPFIHFIFMEVPMVLLILEDLKKKRIYALNVEEDGRVDMINKKFYVIDESENFKFNNILIINKLNWRFIIKNIINMVKAEKLWFFNETHKKKFKEIYPYLKKSILK